MKYLGIDVHSKASVWCLLDESGSRVGRTSRSARSRLGSAERWRRGAR